MFDSHNMIEHKCPCCGYEVECDKETFATYTKGDESFVKFNSHRENTRAFVTDKPNGVYWGKQYEEAILVGCPKCKAVSFYTI